jgi:hypothetical protein
MIYRPKICAGQKDNPWIQFFLGHECTIVPTDEEYITVYIRVPLLFTVVELSTPSRILKCDRLDLVEWG